MPLSLYCRVAEIEYDEQNGRSPLEWLGFDRYKKFIIGAHVVYEKNGPNYLKLVKFNICNDETTVCGKFPLSSANESVNYDHVYQCVLNPKDSSVIVRHHRQKTTEYEVEYGYMFSRLMFETGDWEQFKVENFETEEGEIDQQRTRCLYYMNKFGVIFMDYVGSTRPEIRPPENSGEVGIYSVEFDEVRMKAIVKLNYKLPNNMADDFYRLDKNYVVTSSKIISFDKELRSSKQLHVYDAESRIAYSIYYMTEVYRQQLKTGEIKDILLRPYSPFIEFGGEIYTVSDIKNENEYVTYLQKLVFTKDNYYEFVNTIPLFSTPNSDDRLLKAVERHLIAVKERHLKAVDPSDLSYLPSISNQFHLPIDDRLLKAVKYGDSFAFLLASDQFLLPSLNVQCSLKDIAFRNCSFLHKCKYESLQQLNMPLLLIRKYFGPKWSIQKQEKPCRCC